MKLYSEPDTCALAAHIILNETNTPFEFVKTDTINKTFAGGGNFLAVNPLGFVPALQLDDGTVLTEVSAILQYIADMAGATSIAPPFGKIERYQMQSWLSFVSSEIHRNLTPMFYSDNQSVKDLAWKRLEARFEMLDKHFGGNGYLMGKTYTLPDAYAFTALSWIPSLDRDMARYANIAAYQARVGARPAVQAALRTEKAA